MFANFEMSLSWRDLITRTYREVMKDDAQGIASQLAYYFFLALFPALLCMLAVASFTPGSFIATTLWLAGSLVFRFYAVNWGHYEATYGAVGGVILLLLWFYMSGLVIVIGSEMNAEIEHSSPWGKAPGEKVPGRKKRIGAAAARWCHDHGGRVEPAPATPPPRFRPAAVHRVHEGELSLAGRIAAYAAALLFWRFFRRSHAR